MREIIGLKGRVPDSIRLIGSDGNNFGIIPTREAFRIAEIESLDIMVINTKINPPVCKVVDYGKFKYEQKKKANENKKKQHVVEVKEIKLTPTIDTNDLSTKVDKIKDFISSGKHVKVSVRFKGREIVHSDIGVNLLKDVCNQLSNLTEVSKNISFEGKQMSVVLLPKKGE